MRIPSIGAAAAAAQRVWIRFPFVLFSGFVAAAVGIVLTGPDRNSDSLIAAFAAATLGLPLFTALALAAGRLDSRPLSIGLGLLGVGALLGFALMWPQWTDPVRLRRYAQLSIAFHLLVAFLPYLSGREPNGFWQYNRALLLRFLGAALHSGVLYVGLAVAILALDQLFDLDFSRLTYIRLWLLVGFIFNTWFFLGGVPQDFSLLEQRHDYPRALEVFSQFILIPLVVIYLAILTAYLARVLVTGVWPSNFIGFPVSVVATIGILSLLLVHPLRDDGHRWIGRYTRWFYVALLPAVGMLLAAIWKRIHQYGITEDRYFLAALAVWLAAIALVFLVRPRTGIRWIPMTLCVLALITFAGPFGAYSVSRRSQTARLRSALEASGVLVQGVVKPASGNVPFEARKEISNILTYLVETHGTGSVRSVLGDANAVLPGDSLSRRTRRHMAGADDAKEMMAALGMNYVARYEIVQTEAFYYQRQGAPIRAVPVRGAAYHVRLDGSVPATFAVAGEPWRLERVRAELALVTPRDTLEFPMDALITLARAQNGERDTADVSRFIAQSSDVTATLVPHNYSGTGHGDSAQVYMMSADLYLTFPREKDSDASPRARSSLKARP